MANPWMDRPFVHGSQLAMPSNDNEAVADVTRNQNLAPAISATPDDLTSLDVIARIEAVVEAILLQLDEEQMPVLCSLDEEDEDSLNKSAMMKTFNMSQCRAFTSVLLVLAFCHSLLQAERTTTTREVYYFYVTHFRSQRECDLAIWDAATLLQVPRDALGLKASTRGWFCGDIQLKMMPSGPHAVAHPILDGRALQSIQGSPISPDWLKPPHARPFTVHTTRAQCILVIEKEGVYNRLSEDRFFDDYPCILVTGKGFPDLATRAMVHALHTTLGLPVRGLADCNPFGVMVLHTYQYSERCRGVDGGDRYSVPMEWIGLRPSQIHHWRQQPNTALPDQVFQELTELDCKRLDDHLLVPDHRWTANQQNERRLEELQAMHDFKVELEALNWLGMDFCGDWLGMVFDYQQRLEAGYKPEAGKEWLGII